MVTTIDILSNFPKPKPALPRSKRGTITFIANIEDKGRPTVKRNLTRGVEETDDPYRPPYIDRPVRIDPLILNLEAYKISIEAGGGGLLPMQLTLESSEEAPDQQDTFAVANFDTQVSFSLPNNMVTAPDDASPL